MKKIENKRQEKVSYSRILGKGKRILIRPYHFFDYKMCWDSHLARRPLAGPFDEPIPACKHSKVSEFKDRILRYRKHGKEKLHYVFAIFDRNQKKYLGQVDLWIINETLRWANVGYHIQNQFFGKGYATEAVQVAIRLAINSLGLHRIEAAMDIENASSRQVAIKAGMIREGIRRHFLPEHSHFDFEGFAINAIDYAKGNIAK